MTGSLRRTLLTALVEWRGALRSRRALVLLTLYLATAVLCMYGTISVLGKMESELAKLLMLPDGGQAGVVSETLWKSEPFRRMVRSVVGDSLVFESLLARHPVELIYAWFAFLFAPMLVVLVSGGRVAEDRRTGAVRYMLMRETRLEWSVGKYVGQALLIACAVAVSALGAWAVVYLRRPAATAAVLLLPMLAWGAKAWVYSLAWLGVALGISHLTRTSGKALALGLLFMLLFAALPGLLGLLVEKCGWPQAVLHLEAVVPSYAEHSLWRNSPVAVAVASFHLATLGFLYLMAGAAVFARRNA